MGREAQIFHCIEETYSICCLSHQPTSVLFQALNPSTHKPLQGAKETGLMILTSEDVPSMIKEIQLLKHFPTIQLLCC